MPLTDLQVHSLPITAASAQRNVQASRPLLLQITPASNRCIGHQILEAANAEPTTFGAPPGFDFLQSADNAASLLSRITGIVFAGSVTYKNTETSTAQKTLADPAYEPASQWWRSYFAAGSASMAVTILVD